MPALHLFNCVHSYILAKWILVYLFLLHVGMSVCILVSPKQPKLIEQGQKIMKATEPASQPAVSRLVIFHHVL